MRQILLILTLTLSSITAYAQWNPGQQQQPKQFSPEEFKKNMEGYIKFHAGLTDAEAEKFFPMLSEMQSKQRVNSRIITEQMRKGHDAKSDAEYEKILSYILELEETNHQLTEKYYKKFHTVLSWEKIFKARVAVERFNMLALSRFSPGGMGVGRWPNGLQWQWKPGEKPQGQGFSGKNKNQQQKNEK